MEITIRKGDLAEEKADVLIVNLFEGIETPGGATGAVDAATDGLLSRTMKEEGFKGDLGAVLMIRTEGRIPAKRVVIVGLGKKEGFDAERVRVAAAAAYREAKRLNAKSVATVLHGAGNGELNPKVATQALVEGTRLADYTFAKYKKNEGKAPKTFTIVSKDGRAVRSAESAIALGETYASAQMLTRDLVNTPSEHMKPIDLVEATKEALKGTGVRVRVYDEEALKKMKAGGLLGVGQGSDHPPYMVHMVYKPKKRAKKVVALVGKAVTYDTGGYSLKPSQFMLGMKADMAGAASVIGAMSAIAALEPAAEVHGVFGAAENMVSGRAIRPGDVVTAMNGTSIEIIDTDAEGRVTLADTISYALKQKPDVVIDIATLTGACMIALGHDIAGVWSNDDDEVEKLNQAAEVTGERFWELPLEQSYKQSLKSEIADIKNLGERYGSAISAALFLEEFVNNTPWVHIDACPADARKPVNAYTPAGATGFATRTFLEYLRQI